MKQVFLSAFERPEVAGRISHESSSLIERGKGFPRVGGSLTRHNPAQGSNAKTHPSRNFKSALVRTSAAGPAWSVVDGLIGGRPEVDEDRQPGRRGRPLDHEDCRHVLGWVVVPA